MEIDMVITCPKCKSTNVSKKGKGFDRKKAIIGAAVTGGPGIILGGSNKIKVICNDCGHKFKIKKKK